MGKSTFSFAGLLLLAACTHVAPYQREDLAKSGMDLSKEANQGVFQAHWQDAREGAPGGHSSTGGGCGCN